MSFYKMKIMNYERKANFKKERLFIIFKINGKKSLEK